MEYRANKFAWLIFLIILLFFVPIRFIPNVFLSEIDYKSENTSVERLTSKFKEYDIVELSVEPIKFDIFKDCYTRINLQQLIKGEKYSKTYWLKRCIDPNRINLKYTYDGKEIKIYRSKFTGRHYSNDYLYSNASFGVKEAKAQYDHILLMETK